MGYIYSVLWFIMAVVLLTKFREESKTVYVLSGYFMYAGIWWLIDQVTAFDMLHGTLGWIFRIVSVSALVVSGIVYYLEKLQKTKDNTAGNTSDSAEGIHET